MINLTKIIAGLLVVLALAIGGYALMLARKPAPAAPAPRPAASADIQKGELFPIVVTTRPAPAGQPLAAEGLKVVHLPINPADGLRDTATAAGRVPVADLGEGTPLLESQLVSGLATRLEPGERAVAIRTDETLGVGNKLRPGDLVDVFFVLKVDGKEVDRSQARLLSARKRLLAYGANSIDGQASKAANGGSSPAPQRADAARTAVLAVPVDEVNRIALGEAHGRLLLALRNPADLSEPNPALFGELPTALVPVAAKGQPPRAPLEGLDRALAGLAMADLAAGNATARPTPGPAANGGNRPRASGLEVEVIRGNKQETLHY